MLGRHLPLKELQGALPLGELEKLGPLLRQLDAGRAPVDPLTDKEFLGRLYDAYFGAQALTSPSERRRLLDFVPEAVLRELARRAVRSRRSHGSCCTALRAPWASAADR